MDLAAASEHVQEESDRDYNRNRNYAVLGLPQSSVAAAVAKRCMLYPSIPSQFATRRRRRHILRGAPPATRPSIIPVLGMHSMEERRRTQLTPTPHPPTVKERKGGRDRGREGGRKEKSEAVSRIQCIGRLTALGHCLHRRHATLAGRLRGPLRGPCVRHYLSCLLKGCIDYLQSRSIYVRRT